MSQLLLDEQLDMATLLPSLRRWITVERLHDLRPHERVLDDRVPAILRTGRQPTLITIDRDFWHPRWCDPNYCILYFALRNDEQPLLPALLRTLLRRPEFRTRTRRMGKVARISTVAIEYWEFGVPDCRHVVWRGAPRRRR